MQTRMPARWVLLNVHMPAANVRCFLDVIVSACYRHFANTDRVQMSGAVEVDPRHVAQLPTTLAC